MAYTSANPEPAIGTGGVSLDRALRKLFPSTSKLTFNPVFRAAVNAFDIVPRLVFPEYRALPPNHLRKSDYFFYAQDEYKLRPNLTLNLGLRYTIFDLFSEKFADGGSTARGQASRFLQGLATQTYSHVLFGCLFRVFHSRSR